MTLSETELNDLKTMAERAIANGTAVFFKAPITLPDTVTLPAGMLLQILDLATDRVQDLEETVANLENEVMNLEREVSSLEDDVEHWRDQARG